MSTGHQPTCIAFISISLQYGINSITLIMYFITYKPFYIIIIRVWFEEGFIIYFIAISIISKHFIVTINWLLAIFFAFCHVMRYHYNSSFSHSYQLKFIINDVLVLDQSFLFALEGVYWNVTTAVKTRPEVN